LPVAGGRVCGHCLRQPPSHDHAAAAVDYAFPWDRLITRLKFRAQPELARALAQRLLEAIADRPAPDVVLAVPLGAERLRERGYNQAWELARRVGAARRLPCDAGVLVRGRDTPHQIGLDRAARAANLRGSLWVDPAAQPRIAGRRVALVDDVMTTGATAEAAASALRRAGAGAVELWVLARTE
jgi:ComF family protein